MIKILKSYEFYCVSGGWVCNNTYSGKPFLKAVWFESGRLKDAFGSCCYDEDGLAYTISPRDSIKGIVQNQMDFWGYGGERGTYTYYECRARDPAKCVFEDA